MSTGMRSPQQDFVHIPLLLSTPHSEVGTRTEQLTSSARKAGQPASAEDLPSTPMQELRVAMLGCL